MADQRKKSSGGIAWTDHTWNPVRGCSRMSEGCRNCYAEAMAGRFCGPGEPYEGLATKTADGGRWTGKVELVPEHLADPLRWRKPRMVFVNSMSDLFHEDLVDEQIAAIFGVMAVAREHTFQVLTKRPARARAFLDRYQDGDFINETCAVLDRVGFERGCGGFEADKMPLPNVWLGVSVEDQRSADARIPILLETPAAVRWVSYEPALGPVDFASWLPNALGRGAPFRLDWIVCGGESGPKARRCDLASLRAVVEQTRAADVPVFVKQLGRRPWWNGAGPAPARHVYLAGDAKHGWSLDLMRDRSGGDPVDWPEDLRVREWPERRS